MDKRARIQAEVTGEAELRGQLAAERNPAEDAAEARAIAEFDADIDRAVTGVYKTHRV